MKLNDATRIHIGDQSASKVYIGDTEVWTAAEQRYFYTNTGDARFVLDSPINLTGNFRVITTVSITDLNRINAFAGGGGSQAMFGEDVDAGTAFIRSSLGRSFSTAPGVIPEHVMTKVIFDVNETQSFVDVNGTITNIGADSSLTCRIGELFSAGIGAYGLQGILSDVVVEEDGDPTHSWGIGDNSSTIIDSISGVNGSLENPLSGYWELFTKVGNTWVGNTSGRVIPIAYE